MSSNWINHVKYFQQQNGCSYKNALKGAKGSYQRGGNTDQPKTVSEMFDDEKFPTDHLFWSSSNNKKKKKSKIVPILVADYSPGPVANNPFNPPVEEKKIKSKPKKGSDAWYKKKGENSESYLQDLINRIEKGEGKYGDDDYKRAYKPAKFTAIGRKKKSVKVAEVLDEDEVKINKKKKKNKIN